MLYYCNHLFNTADDNMTRRSNWWQKQADLSVNFWPISQWCSQGQTFKAKAKAWNFEAKDIGPEAKPKD